MLSIFLLQIKKLQTVPFLGHWQDMDKKIIADHHLIYGQLAMENAKLREVFL